MSGVLSISWYWLAAIGVALVGGGLLLWFGLFPRRRGDTPYCAKCGYNLTGIELTGMGARCPECGRELKAATAVVRGERRVRRGSVALGVLLLLLAIGAGTTLGIAAARNFNWYTLKPTAWVLADLRDADAKVVTRALTELKSRLLNNHLRRVQLDELIEFCLAEQTVDTPRAVIDKLAYSVLGYADRLGLLNDAQRERYYHGMTYVRFAVRPVVLASTPIPIAFYPEFRGEEGRYSYRAHVVNLTINASPTQAPAIRWGQRSRAAFMSENESLSIDAPPPGRHQMSCEIEFHLFSGDDGAYDVEDESNEKTRPTPIFKLTRSLSQEFKVIESRTDDFIRFASSPEIDAQIRAALRAEDFVLYDNQGARRLHGKIRVVGKIPTARPGSPPLDLSFDVSVECGGAEYKEYSPSYSGRGWDRIQFQKSPDMSTYFHDFNADCDELTVVLRTNRDAAENSVHMFDVWDGEIRFERVPVTRRWYDAEGRTTTRPTSTATTSRKVLSNVPPE